jgi:bacteriocin-like protein
MTSQNQTGKDSKNLTTPKDDVAPKAAEPSEIERELTDKELAAVVGGLNPQPLPPSEHRE